MKRFEFRLEKLLHLRTQETEQAKRALGLALAQAEEARSAVRTARGLLDSRVSLTRQKEQAGLSPFEFGSLRSHVKLLQGSLEGAAAALEEAEGLIAQRRRELLAARRRERTLQKLRERRREEYVLDAIRQEQHELDEYGDRMGLNGGPLSSDT